jgi:hypothetical protein
MFSSSVITTGDQISVCNFVVYFYCYCTQRICQRDETIFHLGKYSITISSSCIFFIQRLPTIEFCFILHLEYE